MSSRPGAVGAPERRRSARLERRQSSGPYAKDGGSGSTGLTAALGNTELNWSGDSGAGSSKRTTSFGRVGSFGRRKKNEPTLPKHWKKVVDKAGAVSYENTKTHQRSLEVPPFLPAGWKEALHKESGRVYYYHKTTRMVQYDFPTGPSGGGEEEEDDDDDEPPAPEGIMGRIASFARGGKSGKGPARGASFGRKKKPKDAGGDGQQKTVFISCSALLREVKLCVGAEMQPKLDELLKRLSDRVTPAEQAVKELMDMVGSTLVQQAGLSVMNSLNGVLPHGWLEYMDDASGRPYYYNVHKQITTWEKPLGEAPPPPMDDSMEDEEGFINLDCDVETHNVAMTGFI